MSRRTAADRSVERAFMNYRDAHAKFIVDRHGTAVKPFLQAHDALEHAIAARATGSLMRALKAALKEYHAADGHFPEDDHDNLAELKEELVRIVKLHKGGHSGKSA